MSEGADGEPGQPQKPEEAEEESRALESRRRPDDGHLLASTLEAVAADQALAAELDLEGRAGADLAAELAAVPDDAAAALADLLALVQSLPAAIGPARPAEAAPREARRMEKLPNSTPGRSNADGQERGGF